MRKILLGLMLLLVCATGAQAKTPVPAPLTGTITLNNWVAYDQSFTGITLACGKPFHFIVAKPPQYDGTSYTYPLYIWLHPDHSGDAWYYGGNTNPLYEAGNEAGSYNTTSWMKEFPAFYVAPYADQTNGNGTNGSCTGSGNDAVENWGGWFNNGTTGSGTKYSGDTGPNTFAILDMVTFLEGQFSIDTSRIYVNGFSLGAIGSGYLCQHYNILNGNPAVFAACLESGGGVDYADAPVTTATETTMKNVPTWYFSGQNDTASPPSGYNTPLCNGLGGTSSTMTTISSASANQCGTSQMRYTLAPVGHQDTDASGNPVWTNITMNQFAFAQGGGGGGSSTATAKRTADFLNMISVQGCISDSYAPCLNAAQQVADIQYIGATHYRNAVNWNAGAMNAQQVAAWKALFAANITNINQVPYGTITTAGQISAVQLLQSYSATGVYALEGINEPDITTITYNGNTGGGGSSWLPVAQFMNDYIAAIKTTTTLNGLPIYGASRVGGETNNAGLQYNVVPTPAPAGVLMPAGSVLSGALTDHIYPTDQQYLQSGIMGACQPNDPVAGNSFNIQTHWDHVQTFHAGFAGYPDDATAQAQPRVVTEFGYPTTGPGPSANGDRVTEDKKGRCILNGLMTAWQLNIGVVSIFALYDGGTAGFGIMSGSGSPNLSGTYIHNFTSVLADTGGSSCTFTPGTLTYAVTNLPTSGGQQLFQKSNGHYQLVLWNNATNWNMATGTPITVPPVNVAVAFSGGTNFTMTVYDPTVGTTPTQTITSGNAITVPVADYPIIIDVAPTNNAAETISINTVATQTAATSFTLSGSIANSATVPTLQYSVNGGVFQALPASTGTRNAYDQPGSNVSVWNTPFGANATWSSATDPETLAICNGTCTGIITTTGNYGITEYTSASTDSTYTFSAALNGRTIAPDNGSTITATMHVPTGAITGGPYTSNSDKGIVLQDPTSYPNKQYTWATILCCGISPPGIQPGQGPFSAGEGAEWDDITSDTYGQDYDTGLSGFNQGPGLVNACDVSATCNPFFPQIKHGLGYNLSPNQFKSNNGGGTSQVLAPSGWPDRLQDYQSGVTVYTGNLPFGSTLGIPSTATMPSGLDANCQGLWWTMQHYPLIPRDVSGGGFHLRADQVASASAWATSARGCLGTLTGYLRVLTNQHQGGQSFTTQPTNGPGTRVDTGPASLSSGGGNVTQTSFYFTVPGLAAGAANTIAVRDANHTAAVGTSNVFAVTATSGGLTGTPQSPLPSGYLHVSGNQIVDGSGNNVRLACEGYGLTNNYGTDFSNIRNNQGFNCVRYDYYDVPLCPAGKCDFTTMDALVTAATANSIKVIFDHHGNEADCGGQQQNGLWYDKNDSTTPVGGVYWNALTSNVDGCGNTGTITYAQFKANIVALAAHYKGNSTVIGIDLDNEAFIGGLYQSTTVNWGGNNGADERLMCEDTGAAVETADPGVLVICEGPINFVGPFLNGTKFPTGGRNIMDLTNVPTYPVVLAGDTGSHVVYSVHDYPNSISGNTPDSGSSGAAFRITAYGALAISAPVWIGEIAADLDNTNGQLTAEQAWATMMVDLINGQDGAIGGPTFTGCQQPMGTDWFAYDNVPGGVPDGTLNADGTNKAGQEAVWSKFLYTTCSTSGGGGGGGSGGGGGGVGGTTWNSGDKSAGMTLSNGNLTATDTATVASDTVRSNTSASAGKLYFEVTATTSSTDWAIGLSNSSFPLTLHAGLGGDANGIGFYNVSPTQAIYYNAAELSVGSTAGATGDVIYVAVDIPNHLLWISSPVMRAASKPWNNSTTANPGTGVGGVSFTGLTCPCFITYNAEEPSAATLNAGGSFTGTIPTGFVAWQAPITTGNHPVIINLQN